MRFSKNKHKQLHIEWCIAVIQKIKKKDSVQGHCRKGKKKIWHAKKSITYNTGCTLTFLYSELVKLMHLYLVSGPIIEKKNK